LLPGKSPAGRGPQLVKGPVVPALITGVFIGVYTTLDRVGINLGSPWLYAGLLWGLMAVVLALWTRARPLRRRAGENWTTSITIGTMMALAYGLFLVALTLAPVAIAAPLRESAIVLVTVWGVWRLKEREGLLLRLGGAIAIVVGILLISV
jgi:drug/metabolite transporter (DMT)-like permease